MAFAIASEPSICSSMRVIRVGLGLRALPHDTVVRGTRGRRIELARAAGETLADGRRHGVDANLAADRGEPAEERSIRHRTPDVLEREVARRNGAQMVGGKAADEILQAQLVE